MKSILIIALSLFSFGTFAQENSAAKPAKETAKPAKPAVTFKTLKIERVDIPYDSKEPFIFEFKNTGKQPVIITNVHTSCGCTAAEKPTEPVATITVTTNVSTEPIVLTISGNVLAAPTEPVTTPQ